MRTKTYKVYQFEEASKELKAKILENYRDINMDHDWWDPIYENWTEGLCTQGYEDITIYFSGFGSQGDGACFIARIDIDQYIKFHELQKQFPNLYQNSNEYDIAIVQNGRYNYATSTDIQESESWAGVANEEASDEMRELVSIIEQDREEIGNKIYKELEKYHYELQEDEAIIDTIEANDYEFTEEGRID